MSCSWMYADVNWLASYNPMRWSAYAEPAELALALAAQAELGRPVKISANGVKLGPMSVDAAVQELFERSPPESLKTHIPDLVGTGFRRVLERVRLFDVSKREAVLCKLSADALAPHIPLLAENRMSTALMKFSADALAPHIPLLASDPAKELIDLLCKFDAAAVKPHLDSLIRMDLNETVTPCMFLLLDKFDRPALTPHLDAVIQRLSGPSHVQVFALQLLDKFDRPALTPHLDAVIRCLSGPSDVQVLALQLLTKCGNSAVMLYVSEVCKLMLASNEDVACAACTALADVDVGILQPHTGFIMEHFSKLPVEGYYCHAQSQAPFGVFRTAKSVTKLSALLDLVGKFDKPTLAPYIPSLLRCTQSGTHFRFLSNVTDCEEEFCFSHEVISKSIELLRRFDGNALAPHLAKIRAVARPVQYVRTCGSNRHVNPYPLREWNRTHGVRIRGLVTRAERAGKPKGKKRARHDEYEEDEEQDD